MQNVTWQPDNYEQRKEQKGRGSLGQFIERSTSAPPAATAENSLVGNDLLEYVTQGYGDMSMAHKNHPGPDAQANVTIGSPPHATDGSRATANPRNYKNFGTSLLSSSSASDETAGRASSEFLPGDFMHGNGGGRAGSNDSSGMHRATSIGSAVGLLDNAEDTASRYPGFLSRGDPLVRSHSAAPSTHSTLLGPPPGLSSGSAGGGATSLAPGPRRPTSAAAGGSGAVRPNAKTLMDLIQEDIPPSPSSQRQKQQSHSQQQQQAPYEHRSVGGSPAGSPYELAQGSHVFVEDQPLNRDKGAQFLPEVMGNGIPQFQQQQHGGGQQQRQVLIAPGSGYRQGSPESAAHQANLYVQQQQLSPQMLQQQRQQPIYFGGQQSLQQTQGLQAQGINLQSHGLQAQVLPNGQTVYVNTGQQQQFGYSNVQYQSAHHQQKPQLVQQQQLQGGQLDQQFVSVVSLQGGNQQVTYWNPNGTQQPQPLTHTGNIYDSLFGSQTGGAPISMSRIGPADHAGNQYGGRQTPRDKGTRGRRGNARGRGDSKSSSSSASPLLDEFRSTKSRDWTMRRIEGCVVEFCQDQNGSRFIQQRLEMGDVTEQQIVMNEVLPAIRRLRNDVFGNYVVQKLLDFGTADMKADIRDTLEGEMLPLSLQMYGCRVVQKALEALSEDDLPRLLREFHHNVLSCIHDQNGNHVIQKCIEVLNSRATKARNMGDAHRASFLNEQIEFVVDDVLANTTTLSCHPYGCRVLQRILEHCNDRKKTDILNAIKKCHKTLLDDQYGNYVIQHVLQYGREEDRDSILAIVVESGLLGLSRQKFASNVVEKLLKYGNGQQRRAVVREMLKSAGDPSMPSMPTDGNTTVALLMVRDAYANYVVQTTLDVVPDSDEKRLLLEELNSHAEELRNYTFAKHIVAKLCSLNGAG